MKWEPLQQEEIILRESDDKFIVSNLRVSIKESYSFKSIPLQDINSMKILREKSKGILVAGIISACFACYLLFFGNPSNRQSTAGSVRLGASVGRRVRGQKGRRPRQAGMAESVERWHQVAGLNWHVAEADAAEVG